MTRKNSVKIIAINGLVAGLYMVLGLASFGFASGAIQFRVSEGLNHLVVFDKKYFWGVAIGCITFNAFSGQGLLDVLFGGAQTVLALSATILVSRFVKTYWKRLALNTLFFTVSMFMIAWMLHLVLQLPFWMTYLTTAISELIIMTLTAPLMYALNKAVDFHKQIN